MGIKDFYKHLKTKCPECFIPVEYSAFSYQRIALDMMNLLYVYKARDERNWLKRVIEFIIYLRSLKIHPVCVFDGKSHPLKQTTVEKRRQDREKGKTRVETLSHAFDHYKEHREVLPILATLLQTRQDFVSKLTGKPILSHIEEYIQRQYKNYNIHFRSSEIESLKEMLTELGVIVLTAEYDGEALCSYLSAKGLVEAVMSNDSDVFFFGCKQVLFKFTETGAYLVRLTDILEGLGITQEEFIDLCLLCGTDFNTPIRGIGFCRALGFIQRYKSIQTEDFPLKSQLNFEILDKIREMTNIPESLQQLEYTKPLDASKLEMLSFRYNLNLSIRFSYSTEIVLDNE